MTIENKVRNIDPFPCDTMSCHATREHLNSYMEGFNDAKELAARLAKQADDIMERMAAILDEYDLGDAMDIITVYNDWKGEG